MNKITIKVFFGAFLGVIAGGAALYVSSAILSGPPQDNWEVRGPGYVKKWQIPMSKECDYSQPDIDKIVCP